jgi:EpsI family protein
MEKIKNRYLIVITSLFIASVFVYFLSYDIFNKANAGISSIRGIPYDMGAWHGEDVEIEDLIYEILETKSIIHRTYNRENGQEVFLSLVYYPETKVDFHAPEGCLGGKGIRIKKSSKSIAFENNGKNVKININQLIWKKGEQVNLVYYFYKAGKFLGENYIKLRLNLAINKFSNNEKSGSLIRISTPIQMSDTQEASKILVDFAQELYPYLIKYL